MKRFFVFLLLAALLLLSACGQKAGFGVSTNEDNSISVTADRAPKDSVGIGYLTIGENERVVIDASGLNKGGKLRLRFMAGVLGSEDFPDEPSAETTLSGGDSAAFTTDPGEYTVGIIAESKVTGTVRVYTEAADEMSLLGYTPDSLLGIWLEKNAGRGNIEITKTDEDLYRVQVNWGGTDDMAVWTMTASPAASNILHYEDARHSVITFGEDGTDTETLLYENGTGTFTLLSTNEIMWQDDVDHAGEDTLFISSSPAADSETKEEITEMLIRITAGEHTITAVLYGNEAGRALWNMLPMTLPMMNLYGREMCYRFGNGGLPDGEAEDTGYAIGDISYWPPAGSLVILYAQNGEIFEQQPIGHTDDDLSFFNGMPDTDILFEKAE